MNTLPGAVLCFGGSTRPVKTFVASLVSICLLSNSSQVIGALFSDLPAHWDLISLAKSNNDSELLGSSQGGGVRRINVSQMRYIYAVKSSLEKVSEQQVQVLIVPGEQPNAFASRVDGDHNVVGINFAMLDILGRDMHGWAALLGHEFAHLRLNHTEQGGKRHLGFWILKMLGRGVLQTAGKQQWRGPTDLAFTAVETTFSRDQEREADYLGMIWAIESGYDPEGGVRLHQELYKSSLIHPIPFLSTHPSGPERIETMRQMAKRLSRPK